MQQKSKKLPRKSKCIYLLRADLKQAAQSQYGGNKYIPSYVTHQKRQSKDKISKWWAVGRKDGWFRCLEVAVCWRSVMELLQYWHFSPSAEASVQSDLQPETQSSHYAFETNVTKRRANSLKQVWFKSNYKLPEQNRGEGVKRGIKRREDEWRRVQRGVRGGERWVLLDAASCSIQTTSFA